MKKKNIIAIAVLAIVFTGGIIWASDHIDAPAVTGQSTDITDLYAFQGANTSNLVFVVNTQGLLAPSVTAAAKFDPNTLIQINIDNTGDNVEDLVIQAIYEVLRTGKAIDDGSQEHTGRTGHRAGSRLRLWRGFSYHGDRRQWDAGLCGSAGRSFLL
jgi:hypothetical protein